MQSYRLFDARKELIKVVAEKTMECIEPYGSAMNYLCSNYMVLVNADVPDFVLIDNDNGVVIGMQLYNEDTALKVLAGLKLFHYGVKCDDEQKVVLREQKLFLQHCHKLQ